MFYNYKIMIKVSLTVCNIYRDKILEKKYIIIFVGFGYNINFPNDSM